MSELETKKKLLSSRKDLLDIGLRNSMISFSVGAKGLMIVNPRFHRPSCIFADWLI